MMKSGIDSKSARRLVAWAAVALAGVAGAAGMAGVALASCAQTPTNVPVQTFEQPKSLDVMCLNVFDPSGNPIIPAVPFPEAACAQVPANTIGATLPFHLFALVTQETRGEVAVVDLTAGNVVDVDPNTPGINFLPVGPLPSDIAVTPDGRTAFVGSGAPNAPAIYALPSRFILGDSQTNDGGVALDKTGALVPALTTWPVCSLPQAPGAIRVLPNALLPSVADGGTPIGSAAGYSIVAVLPGDSVNKARVVTIDPAPLLRGDLGNDAGLDAGQQDLPGQLTPCTYLDESPLDLAPPPSASPPVPGPAWDDGVKYVDGGIADADIPTPAVACASNDAGGSTTSFVGPTKPAAGTSVLDTSGPIPILYVADFALPLIHVVDLSDPTAPKELAPLLATSLAAPHRTVNIGQIAVSPTTREYKRFLYAIDRTEGSILVYDITDPVAGPRSPLTRPHSELDPFQPPDRIIFGAPVVSVAFAQHDWPLLFTYQTNGLTNPLTAAQTGLLCNPNPTVDQPLADGGVAPEQGPFSDPGAYYRASINSQSVAFGLGPARLRGIFAFATLSNGSMITIDVDDWDAPCRRPDPLAPPGGILALAIDGGASTDSILDEFLDRPFSSIAPPEPADGVGADAGDPYHAPVAYSNAYTDSPVSLEWFFPVSAPHRPRSAFFLRNDPASTGDHAPFLLGVPQLFVSGAPLATQGPQAIGNPLIVPTDTPFVDPSVFTNPTQPNPLGRIPTLLQAVDAGPEAGTAGAVTILTQSNPSQIPNIRFAWEDPVVQVDQDWTITYEGPLPGFFDNGGNPLVLANVLPRNGLPTGGTSDGAPPDFSAAWLQNKDAYFCSKGIEDYALGTQRAQVVTAAVEQTIPDAGGVTSDSYALQVADYVQLTDDVLPNTDPYWKVPNTCWDEVNDPTLKQNQDPDPTQLMLTRNNYCNEVFGQTLDPTTPSLQRDFPIIEAHDDKLLIGRFGYRGGVAAREPGSPDWAVVGPDPTNAKVLALMQCCFHNQIHFNVRTGGEWVANGSRQGVLHHVVATGADARCETSCEPRDVLLNARAAPIPRPPPAKDVKGCDPTQVTPPSITRDSVLAMRNPMFSFFIWNGQDPNANCADRPPARDTQWTFSTRGGFSPQLLNLAASSGISPQAMRFIDSLGQLAVIDGASQGLMLVDLNTLSLAHAPYF